MKFFATAAIAMLLSGCASMPALSTARSDCNPLFGAVRNSVSKRFLDGSVFEPSFVLSFPENSGKDWIFSHGIVIPPDSGTDTLPVAFAMCTNGAASTAYAVKRYIERTEDGHFAWASVDSRDIEAVALSLACSASRHAMQYNPLLGLLRPIPESAWVSLASMRAYLNEEPKPVVRQFSENPEPLLPETVSRIRKVFSDLRIEALREELCNCEFGCVLLLDSPWFLWTPNLHGCLPVPDNIRETIEGDLSHLGTFPEMSLIVECKEGVVGNIVLICFGIVDERAVTLEFEVEIHPLDIQTGCSDHFEENAIKIGHGARLRPGHWLTSTWQ